MNKRKIIAISSFFMVILLVILFSDNRHNLPRTGVAEWKLKSSKHNNI